jgi:hypothetical protein
MFKATSPPSTVSLPHRPSRETCPLTQVQDYGFLTFIHEPSFYQLLDKGAAPRELTLMLVVCSLQLVGAYHFVRVVTDPKTDTALRMGPRRH